MRRDFEIIKEIYNNFYRELLKKGQLPFRDTGNGFWGGAVSDEVFEAFTQVGLGNFRNFIDLGSGDGKVVLIASLFCQNTIGIEIDKELFLNSEQLKSKTDRYNAKFFNKDFLEHDLSIYDALFINPDKPISRGLENKLLKELNGKLIVYGQHFHPNLLKKEGSIIVNGTPITIYSK
jgi:hypothetical protein